MKKRRQAFDRYARKNYPELYRLHKASETPGAVRNQLALIFSQLAEVEAIVEMPLKHIRIQQLLDTKFNVVDYRFWLKGQLKDRQAELEDFFCENKNRGSNVSVRTYTDEKYTNPSPQLPVRYNLGSLSLVKSFALEQNASYHTLVNQTLPLDQSLYTGNIILMPHHYMASCVKGFGTPRSADQLDRDTLVFKRKYGSPIPDWAPPFLVSMSDQLQALVPELRPITLEFSYYPKPVGLLKRQEVFWEWRGGSAHDLDTIASRYIEKSDSFDLIANFGSRKKVLPFPTQKPVEPKVEVSALVLPTPRGRAKLTVVK